MSFYFTAGLRSTLTPDEIRPNNPRIAYHNHVVRAGISSSSSIGGFPASNLANPSTAEKWKCTFPSQRTVSITTPNEAHDYIAIAAHNLADLDGAGFKLQYHDGSSYIDVFGYTVASNNSSVIYNFQSITASLWRLVIDPQGGTSANDIEIGVIYLGRITTIPRRIYTGHSPINFNPKTKIQNNNSETGHFLGRVVISSELNSSISVQDLSPAFVRTELVPFQESANENPFFFAWRPDSYDDETAYCWLNRDMRIKNQRSNGMMEFRMSFKGFTI